MNAKFYTLGFAILLIAGCAEKYGPISNIFTSLEENGCTTCHLSASTLKDVADPLPPPPDHTGEG